MQVIFVFVNKRQAPKRVMLREKLIVLSGSAPGVHAMRVAYGAQREDNAVVEPDLELTITRGFEISCESVPGSVVQFGALFRAMRDGDGFSTSALASVVVSALTTGFTAATLSFE
jgi:hypothetical protein